MDIKAALGKIEQYWQIIRNLHFHIEQENEISPEEYALIDKYLKVISQKYEELVKEQLEVDEKNKENVVSEQKPEEIVEESQPEVVIDEVSESTTIEEPSTISVEPEIETVEEVETESEAVEFIEPKSEPEPLSLDVPEQQTVIEQVEETLEMQSEIEKEIEGTDEAESIFEDLLSTQPVQKSISSFLEEMLDSPDDMPEQPMLFPSSREEQKVHSLNDKLKQMKTGAEDLNTKIKRTTAEKISLNDKFEFVRELFGNNPVDYAAAIQKIDNHGETAWNQIFDEYSNKYNWSDKVEVVEKLKGLISQK